MVDAKDGRAGLVKVLFRLERDLSGWPPLNIEGLWAKEINESEYMLCNVPFYVRGIANGDVVSVVEERGERFFENVVREGGHGTIRVLLKRTEQLDDVLEKLEGFRCGIEVAEPRLLAIDVQVETSLAALLEFLDAEEAAARLGYEVGCKSW